jgi:hypothetical protein
MRLFAIALAAALFALLAAVRLQYGPEWKVDAAVEAAIARGDLRHAREIAVTARQWAWIVDARGRSSDAHVSRPASGRLMMVRDRAADRQNVSDDL